LNVCLHVVTPIDGKRGFPVCPGKGAWFKSLNALLDQLDNLSLHGHRVLFNELFLAGIG